MVFEGVILAATLYGCQRIINYKYYKYKKIIHILAERRKSLKNDLGESIKFIDFIEVNGHDQLLVDISRIISYEELLKEEGYLRSSLKASKLEFEIMDNFNVRIDIYKS